MEGLVVFIAGDSAFDYIYRMADNKYAQNGIP